MCVTGQAAQGAPTRRPPDLIDRVVDGDLTEGAVRVCAHRGGHASRVREDARARREPRHAGRERAAVRRGARSWRRRPGAIRSRRCKAVDAIEAAATAAVRRRLPARARAVLRVRRDRAGQGADSRLLRRARGRRRSAACRSRRRAAADRPRRDRRRRHDGRRHRHGLRQRRPGGHGQGLRRQAALDAGFATIRTQLRRHGQARPADRGGRRRAAGAHRAGALATTASPPPISSSKPCSRTSS